MTTYQPTGRGLCAQCGRDVGAHDAGHEFVSALPVGIGADMCKWCNRFSRDSIHDVGRALRCPEVRDD